MKILVPDHYSERDLREIRAVSPELETAKLNIKWNNGTLWRIARKLSHKLLPDQERWQHLFNSRQRSMNFLMDGKSLSQAGKDVDILLCSWVITGDILINLLPFLPNLKWIHSTVTDVYHILFAELIKSNIILTSSIGVHSTRVAEFVLALMLNIAKKIPGHLDLQRKRRWQSIQAEELKGKIVGIIGYGHIGREVAKRAQAFEMKVMAIKRSYTKSENGVIVLHSSNLRELLKTCDFLVISAPLTKETKGMIGEIELSIMKKEAYVINISRGGIVDEKALIKALKENWIAGACLDVLVEQPLRRDSPFYSLPNVVITHRSAYFSPNSQREIFNLFLTNLKRFIAGEKLLCIVDKEKGY
ncbi:MAG: D-2-hydroxyacid dehydrogenase [Nitrospirota bacterium]